MNRTLATALLACAASAGVLAWQATQGPAPVVVETGRHLAVATGAEPSHVETVPDADEIAAALERPPFAPTRRPPAVAAPAGAALAAPVPVAIALAAERHVVLLRVAGQERLVRARAGDRVGGWLVLEVLRDRVMLVDAAGRLHPVLLAGPGRGPSHAPLPVPAPAAPAMPEPADQNATETVRLAEEIIRATQLLP